MNTQNKIKKISKTFHYLFVAFFIAIPICHLLSWMEPMSTLGLNGFFFNFVPHNLNILHPLAGWQKFLGFLIGGVEIIIIEMIVFYLIQLFKLYQKAEIFSKKNVRYIKKIGLLLLTTQIIKPFCEGLLSLVVTSQNPVGQRMIAISFTETNIGILIIACIAVLISWIMAEGCQLREEQQLTI